jgi:hypothetical protein
MPAAPPVALAPLFAWRAKLSAQFYPFMRIGDRTAARVKLKHALKIVAVPPSFVSVYILFHQGLQKLIKGHANGETKS